MFALVFFFLVMPPLENHVLLSQNISRTKSEAIHSFFWFFFSSLFGSEKGTPIPEPGGDVANPGFEKFLFLFPREREREAGGNPTR